MNSVINLIVSILFTLAVGYTATEMFLAVEEAAIKKIDKGFTKKWRLLHKN